MRDFTFNSKEHVYRWLDTGEVIPSVNQLIEKAGLTNFGSVPAGVMAAAQDRGTKIHLACEFDDLGTLADIDPEHIPYLEGWRQFKSTFELAFTAQQIELGMVSEKHNFAGTLDRFYVDHTAKIVWVIDIKSGSALYRTTGLQLAGYAVLLKENFPELAEYKFVRSAVQLKKSGYLKYKNEPYVNPGDEGTFIEGCVNGNMEVIQAWLKRA